MITVTRYHDFSAGHRVYGHENKCALLHGHNYRIHFTLTPMDGLDIIGRVLDFSVIKSTLCQWLEENWDHKFLIYKNDTIFSGMSNQASAGIVVVPFNPTAENMAKYLVNEVAPGLLKPHGVKLIECKIEETRKCSATYRREKC